MPSHSRSRTQYGLTKKCHDHGTIRHWRAPSLALHPSLFAHHLLVTILQRPAVAIEPAQRQDVALAGGHTHRLHDALRVFPQVAGVSSRRCATSWMPAPPQRSTRTRCCETGGAAHAVSNAPRRHRTWSIEKATATRSGITILPLRVIGACSLPSQLHDSSALCGNVRHFYAPDQTHDVLLCSEPREPSHHLLSHEDSTW